MEHITVTRTIDRYTVELDDGTECPLLCGWGGNFALVRAGYHSTLDQFNTFDPNTEPLPEGVTLHTALGYSQGEWVEYYADKDAPVEDLDMWLRGDVYRVTDNLTGDSIGEIYADSEAEALNYYMEEI